LAGQLGSHLAIAQRIDEGCALMLECVEIARQNASEDNFSRYLSLVALARMEQERPAEALPFFERAALISEHDDPSSTNHAISRAQLGKCLLALGRYQEALNHLELALRLVDADRVEGKRRHAQLMNDIMEMMDRAKSGTS
jgi:tetratricopeptide (TPR) repeat protein